MTRVAGSSAQYCSRSLLDTSALLPMLTKVDELLQALPPSVTDGLGDGVKNAFDGIRKKLDNYFGRSGSVLYDLHHAFPKYLGGAIAQTRAKMPQSLHQKFHAALDRWMNGKYSRFKSADFFKTMDPQQIISDLRKFYETADGGIFAKYLPDFERALRESGF